MLFQPRQMTIFIFSARASGSARIFRLAGHSQGTRI